MRRGPPLVATPQGAALPDRANGPTPTPNQLRVVAGLAAGSVAFGALVLVSWRMGQWGWLALAPQYVPTAPGTGLLAVMLGVALLIRARARSPHDEPRIVPLLALLTLALAVALALAEQGGAILPIERWFTQIDATRGGVPLGQTALATSLLFGTIALGMLLRQVPQVAPRWRAALHLAAVIAALLLLQGYLFGGPLLYDRGVIPVAALTAAVLLALSTAALVSTGPAHWPMRLFAVEPAEGVAPSVDDARWFVVLVITFVASSGYFWAVAEGDRVQARAESNLLTLANLKAGELAQWYAGYYSTARAVAALPLRGSALATPEREDASTSLRRAAAIDDWLRTLRVESGMTSVALFTPDGQLITYAPREQPSPPSGPVPAFDPSAPNASVVADLHRKANRVATQRFWAPVREFSSGSTLVAWVQLAVDIDPSLLPLLEVSRDDLPTLELLLWRADKDSAEVVNEANGPDGSIIPSGQRLPLDTASEVPGVRGLLGEVGLIRAVDLRGVPVTSSVAPVPGTDWVLVAKMDLALLRGSVFRIALRATGLSVIIAMGLGAALLAAWSRRDLAAASRELRLVNEREETMEELVRTDRILRMRSAANLALVRAQSEAGMLQEITDVAVREGGYRMAWVGRAEPDGDRLVRPIAVSGHEDGYLQENPVNWLENDARGTGPAGRCLRTGESQAVQDLLVEHGFAAWRAGAAARGYAACCAIPLRLGEEMYGALLLYSAEAHAFNNAEIALLTEIGNDVSFGLGALRDHQAVAAQRAELLLFRQVMERSSDAIFLTDAVTGRFLAFNAAAPRWLGHTADELRGMGPMDIVPQVGGAPGWASVVEQIRAEDSVVWPRTFCRKDGTSFPVEVALTAIDTGDGEVILSIARDISEREQLMIQLLRAQKMESVGRLAGGVAHDFNNLLTVINATVDLAMPEVPAGTSLQRDLEEIRGASNRAAALTRQLLAFSRQQVLHQEALALNDLITGFLKLLRRVIGEDVEVKVALAPTSPTVLADAGQLEQVLMNLSVNARDAMPNGGRLTIQTSRVRLDEEDAARHDTMRPGDYALLEVADTGSGMDRKTQAMIFEPFFTTKAPGKGTGLGLSTVYGIIKQMGGGIWVSSELGVGTTFKIYLPIVAVAGVSVPPQAALQPSTGTETILVVEDEAAIRAVVRRVLERVGYTVLEAESGSEALKAFRGGGRPVDLVITDLVMPGMTGAELAAELRRTHPGTRILLTSGYSADVVEGKIVPGVDCHFISKPYTATELTAEVRRVLDGAMERDPV